MTWQIHRLPDESNSTATKTFTTPKQDWRAKIQFSCVFNDRNKNISRADIDESQLINFLKEQGAGWVKFLQSVWEERNKTYIQINWP